MAKGPMNGFSGKMMIEVLITILLVLVSGVVAVMGNKVFEIETKGTEWRLETVVELEGLRQSVFRIEENQRDHAKEFRATLKRIENKGE